MKQFYLLFQHGIVGFERLVAAHYIHVEYSIVLETYAYHLIQ